MNKDTHSTPGLPNSASFHGMLVQPECDNLEEENLEGPLTDDSEEEEYDLQTLKEIIGKRNKKK